MSAEDLPTPDEWNKRQRQSQPEHLAPVKCPRCWAQMHLTEEGRVITINPPISLDVVICPDCGWKDEIRRKQ